MNQTERAIIEAAIRRLRGENSAGPAHDALVGPAKLYLDTWVIPALEEILKPAGERDLRLACSLISLPATRKEPADAPPQA